MFKDGDESFVTNIARRPNWTRTSYVVKNRISWVKSDCGTKRGSIGKGIWTLTSLISMVVVLMMSVEKFHNTKRLHTSYQQHKYIVIWWIRPDMCMLMAIRYGVRHKCIVPHKRKLIFACISDWIPSLVAP